MLSGGRERLTSLALALGGGVALFFSAPAVSIFPLAYLSFALLFLALRRATMRWAFLAGLVFHLAYFLPLLWWAYFSIGTLPWVALAVAESLIMAVAGALWAGLRGRTALSRRPLAGAGCFALLYTGLEEVRGLWPFGGFPWGRLAFTQADAPMAKLAFLGGQPVVTFAVALTGALAATALLGLARLPLAAPWVPRPARSKDADLQPAGLGRPGGAPGQAGGADQPRSGSRPPAPVIPSRRTAAIAAALAIGLVLAPGLLRLSAGEQAGTLALGAVQGNIAEKSHGAETRMRGVILNHVNGTIKLAERVGQGTLDLVVWPENSADISPRADARVAAQIDQAARAAGAPILVGAVEYNKDHTRLNISLLWQAGLGVSDWYAKQHPAPFAEYIPLRPVIALFSDKVNLVTSEMVPGHKPATITFAAQRLGRQVTIADVICFEVAYDSIVRQGVRDGGQLIVVQTNNASFGMTAEGAQQLAMTRMRAIEHSRAAVQISTVGLSGIVAPDGRLEQSGGLFTAEQFTAAIPLRDGHSPAGVIAGPAGAAAMIAAGLAALAIAVLAARQRRSHT